VLGASRLESLCCEADTPLLCLAPSRQHAFARSDLVQQHSIVQELALLREQGHRSARAQRSLAASAMRRKDYAAAVRHLGLEPGSV